MKDDEEVGSKIGAFFYLFFGGAMKQKRREIGELTVLHNRRALCECGRLTVEMVSFCYFPRTIEAQHKVLLFFEAKFKPEV